MTASDDSRGGLPTSDAPTSTGTGSSPSTSEEASSSWSWRSGSSETDAPATAQDDTEDGTTAPSSEPSRITIVETTDDASTASSNAESSADEFTWTWEPAQSPDNGPESESDVAGTVSERDAAGVEDTPLATEPDASSTDVFGDDQQGPANPPADSWSSGDTSRGDPASGTGSDRVNVSWGSATDANGDSGPSMEVEEDAPRDLQPAAGAPGAPDSGAAPGEPAPEPGSETSDEDPLDRARRLVDELRSLIPPPRLYQEKIRQTFHASASASATAELRNDLESARSTSDFTDLRSTLESAQARPRDVDTMLELVGRIDLMLDALDDRDRLAAAVDRALDQLRSDAEGAPSDQS